MTFRAEVLFELADFEYRSVFDGTVNAWDILPSLGGYIRKVIKPNVAAARNGSPMIMEKTELENGAVLHKGCFLMDDDIEIQKNAVVEPAAMISGPAVIGGGTVVRQGAYVRGKVICGRNCVVGHATEMKNAVMTGDSKAGHFAYIGDSILGAVNLGAGTKLANFKLDGGEISLLDGNNKIKTGLRKFGAILGDGVSTGCNSVTMPGTVMGKNCLLYPNTTARGAYPAGTVIKLRQNTEITEGK